MNLRNLVLAVMARLPVVLATLLITALTTLVVSLMLPKNYTSTATLVVDLKAPEPVAGAVSQAQLMPSYLATQIDIITSPKVALKAIQALKLQNHPLAQAQYQAATGGKGSIESWLVEAIRSRVKVQPSKDSGVMTLSYTANDPEYAAMVANALAQAYIETNLELRVEPARVHAGWFEQQTRIIRDKLEAAQTKLSRFQREHGIVVGDEKLDVETARLTELHNELAAVQSVSAEAHSRSRQARGGARETLPEVVSNPLIQGLKTDLSRKEAELSDMSSHLGRNHPRYLRQAEEVSTLRARLDAEIAKVAGSLATTTRIQTDRESELRAVMEVQKAKVLKMRELRDELAVLQREVESAQRAYDLVNQRLTQTSLESQTTLTNISVLMPAEPPIKHSSPQITLNTLLSMLVGGVLGLALALLFELLDRRIRTADDLAAALDAPVLGVLGKVSSPRLRERICALLLPRRESGAHT